MAGSEATGDVIAAFLRVGFFVSNRFNDLFGISNGLHQTLGSGFVTARLRLADQLGRLIACCFRILLFATAARTSAS